MTESYLRFYITTLFCLKSCIALAKHWNSRGRDSILKVRGGAQQDAWEGGGGHFEREYVSGSRKRDLMAQKFFLELLIQSSSTIFEL